MRFQWQDLDDGPIKKYWRNGRCWIGPYGKSLNIEWIIPNWKGWSVGFGINDGDSNKELTFHIGVGLLTLYFAFPFLRFPVGYWFEHQGERHFLYSEREFKLYWFNGALWVCPWVDPLGDTMKRRRWYHKSYRIAPMDILFGRPKHSERILEEGNCLIPMLEGCYDASYKLFVSSWKRPRLPFTKELERITIDVPKGIPHEGKGENSWDCGEDGTYGITCSAATLEEGIGKLISSVLRDRKRYGGNHIHRSLSPYVLRNLI